MLKRDSIPGKVIDLVLQGKIILLLSDEILTEYEDVLGRNKFGFPNTEVRKMINQLRKRSLYLSRTTTNEVFSDTDDVVFFEIALSGRPTMDAYLVTGNLKHYPIRNYVVTPRQMIEIIEGDSD